MPGDTARGLDVPALLARLTLEQRAALLHAEDFWRTTPVERLAVSGVLLADGPHGLRRQAEGGDHLGLGGSVRATSTFSELPESACSDATTARRAGKARMTSLRLPSAHTSSGVTALPERSGR